MPKLLLPLVALLAVGGSAAGAYFWVASGGGVEEAAVAQPTPTPEPAPTATAMPTPEPSPGVPADWLAYVDPVLSFSLRYPPDLVLKDLTPDPSAGGLYQRVLDFRSPTDSSRALSIEVSTNASNLTPEDWALSETTCVPKTIKQSTVAGKRAVLCTEEATEIPNALVVLEHLGKIYEIGSLLTRAEFDSVLSSLRI